MALVARITLELPAAVDPSEPGLRQEAGSL
jgi:hypothetical protein